MGQSTKSIFKDPQNIIAIGVTVISLCALLVSLMQTRIMQEERELMREYSRASVWPRLELGLAKGHNSDDGSLTELVLSLTNNGVGPAIITDVKVTSNDKTANDWWEVFEIQEIPDSIETSITNRVFNGRVIKAGELVSILDLSDNLPLAQAFFERLEGFSIEIYYESIYEEKWMYDGDKTIEVDDFEELPQEEQFE